MEELLGSKLIDPQGTTVETSSVIKGAGVFGLYFSAHWCPPCKMFTPRLSRWYTEFHKNHPDKNFTIIFVSSDRSKEDFNVYRKEMAFHALPFEQRETKTRLSSKYKVQGIPTLIFLNEHGDVISRDGRSIVADDPKGDDYPWTPKPFSEAMAGPLLKNATEKDAPSLTFDYVKGKYVAYYFSAHWCGPCRTFTPQLIETYNTIKAANKPFEIIFVTGDNAEEEYGEYYGSMPWLALPFDDKRINYLNRVFEVEGIPTLVLTNPEGKMLRNDLREVIDSDPTGSEFPWPRKALNSLQGSLGTINEVPTVVIFTDNSKAQEDQAKDALGGLAQAEEAHALSHDGEFRTCFAYTAEGEEEAASGIRAFLALSSLPVPLVVFVDIPNGKKFVKEGTDLSVDGVTTFVNSVLEGKVASKGVRD